MPRGATPPRTRRAAIFAAGAAATALLPDALDLGFEWTPALVGAIYAAAALSEGRKGGYWATAIVLLTWGAGVLAYVHLLDAPAAGIYAVAFGLAVVLAHELDRGGYEISMLGVGATIAAAGVFLIFEREWELLRETESYAVVLAAVALVNLVLAARRR